jgi:hypothetical protein
MRFTVQTLIRWMGGRLSPTDHKGIEHSANPQSNADQKSLILLKTLPTGLVRLQAPVTSGSSLLVHNGTGGDSFDI